jgi:histidinol-phosphate/aromatic aminotransferase/cobyric acid decarboxylase-like protein
MNVLDELFGRLKRFTLIRGAANFALVQLRDDMNLDWVLRHLCDARILVRDCRNFEGLSKSSFRFCIRQSDDNRELIAALQSMDNG